MDILSERGPATGEAVRAAVGNPRPLTVFKTVAKREAVGVLTGRRKRSDPPVKSSSN
jgi:hypothetical protein